MEKWEEDEAWLKKSLGTNNPPTDDQVDDFCERVAIMVAEGTDEDNARIACWCYIMKNIKTLNNY